jgi:hypothetical protein
MHRSILSDCKALFDARYSIDHDETCDPDAVAAICHRIAVRARAFHQTLAMDEVNSRRAAYCIGCGSSNVEICDVLSTVKDPGTLEVICSICGYRHFELVDNLAETSLLAEALLSFQDEGSTDPRMAEHLVSRCRWINDDLRSITLPFLAQTPGVNPPVSCPDTWCD